MKHKHNWEAMFRRTWSGYRLMWAGYIGHGPYAPEHVPKHIKEFLSVHGSHGNYIVKRHEKDDGCVGAAYGLLYKMKRTEDEVHTEPGEKAIDTYVTFYVPDPRECVHCGDPIDEEYSDAVGEDLCEDCYMEKYSSSYDEDRAAERRQMGLVDF